MERRSKILIVEDSRANIDVLVEILGDEYDLRVSLDGAAAIDLVYKDLPDLILLDVIMPGMNGYEVCSQLQSNVSTSDIPIIFVTGMDDAQDEAYGRELGAVDYLRKPLDRKTTIETVRFCLTP